VSYKHEVDCPIRRFPNHAGGCTCRNFPQDARREATTERCACCGMPILRHSPYSFEADGMMHDAARCVARQRDAALAKISRLRSLLVRCIADDGGLYDLGLRAGRARATDAETDRCIAAADALEDDVRAALAERGPGE
jgi:hypothetical protein